MFIVAISGCRDKEGCGLWKDSGIIENQDWNGCNLEYWVVKEKLNLRFESGQKSNLMTLFSKVSFT